MTADSDWPISVDGRLSPRGAACVRADDSGLLHGLAVFDTLLVESGQPVLARRHLERLADAADRLSIAIPPRAVLERALDDYARALRLGEAALRVTVTRGADGARGHVILAARSLETLPVAGVDLVIERRFRAGRDELDRLKTTSRARHALAREAARAAGAHDALLLGPDQDCVETTTANLWIHDGRGFVTPPASSGALEGVTRAVLLAELTARGEPCRAAPIRVADLEDAAEIFLTNAVRRVIGVRAIAGVVRDRPGTLGRAAQRARELVLAAERRA